MIFRRESLAAQRVPFAVSQTRIGFWCMPISSSGFIKLPIKPSYILNDGKTIRLGRAAPVWAVAANASKLVEHFPWIAQVYKEIEVSFGNDIFKAQANPASQQVALEYLTKEAFAQQWLYVVEESDYALIGCGGGVAFPDPLYYELTLKHLQQPPSIKVSRAVEMVQLCDYRGDRSGVASIDDVLRSS